MEVREPIPFVPFRRNVESLIYHSRGLPHLRQDGCTYFVTFRTAGSMPSSFREKWIAAREAWLKSKGCDPEKSEQNQVSGLIAEQYVEFFCDRMDKLLDKGAGDCVLRRESVATIVEEALRFYDGKLILLGGYVIMPNHLHVLMTPLANVDLEKTLGLIKGFSGKMINEFIGSEGVFWQAGSYDHLVRTGDHLKRFQKYIQNNPAEGGLKEGSCIAQEAACRLN